MPKKPTKPKKASGRTITRFQSFTTQTLHRSALKNATYNPRYLSARAKAKLKDSLTRVGLVQPIVWNKRTGNIVGGHQRIAQLDSMEGSADYSITVAVVDVNHKREKELNILLNNTEVAGEWDLEKLKDILSSEIDMLNTGFDQAEFMKMFGEAPSQPDSDHQAELSKQLAEVKGTYEKLTQMGRNKDDTDFYNVVVFGSWNERKEFLGEFGFEDNRYIDGRTLVQVLRDVKESKTTADSAEGQGTSVGEDKPKTASIKPT